MLGFLTAIKGTISIYFPIFVMPFMASSDVAILLPQDLLSLSPGSPLLWEVVVLVTSLSPPRVYIHPGGLAWSGLEGSSSRKNQKNVCLLELHQLISELANEKAATQTLKKVEQAILRAIRVAGKYSKLSITCERCFQMIEVVFIFNSSFHPFIFEIKPSQYLDHLSSLSDYLLELNILEDITAMVMSRVSTADDVFTILFTLGVTQYDNNKGQVCNLDGSMCLKEKDLIFLLDTRREQKSSKNWKRLYPSSIPCEIFSSKSLLQDVNFLSSHFARLELVALSMEKYFLCPTDIFDKYFKELITDIKNFDMSQHLFSYIGPHLSVQACQNDTAVSTQLLAINTHPFIQLYPEFSPLTREYLAFVDYDFTLVQIEAIPKHCQAVVRLTDLHDGDSSYNFSIGVGENNIDLRVIVKDNMYLDEVNTYKIKIHRYSIDHNVDGIDSGTSVFPVCQIQQDCSLPVSITESCGLQTSAFGSWNHFIKYHSTLPVCGGQHFSGQWMVPCKNCNDSHSCNWSKAIWHQAGCRERSLSTREIQKCFSGKRVLYIGDSTNRGIFHYAIERVNGSLTQWDITHNIKVYDSLNLGQTDFGFAYFPQFWLPLDQRPLFDKALSQLLKRTSNNLDPVFVLGGVQWLTTNHIDTLISYLKRQGLGNAKVIVKGFGAGFYQPVRGLHQLTAGDYQKLARKNQELLSYAIRQGFSIVDTFSMTMARYKDFMQGKCTCHFHKVQDTKISVKNRLSHTIAMPVDHTMRYHVEGDINRVYSEMVINRICSPHQGG
ncbi:cadherin-like and PC-esterase domain-containing protein 1 [Physella acuta]|uniref:cadherin-like and PC-esterase domain-containing protein 1 n=1 Tax=Physella acuta TaxID=109671 RepID=UPI0027DC6BB1|nr:cadherin-like and PC-esterase domain-containing protein 1 [Physella acuta]